MIGANVFTLYDLEIGANVFTLYDLEIGSITRYWAERGLEQNTVKQIMAENLFLAKGYKAAIFIDCGNRYSVQDIIQNVFIMQDIPRAVSDSIGEEVAFDEILLILNRSVNSLIRYTSDVSDMEMWGNVPYRAALPIYVPSYIPSDIQLIITPEGYAIAALYNNAVSIHADVIISSEEGNKNILDNILRETAIMLGVSVEELDNKRKEAGESLSRREAMMFATGIMETDFNEQKRKVDEYRVRIDDTTSKLTMLIQNYELAMKRISDLTLSSSRSSEGLMREIEGLRRMYKVKDIGLNAARKKISVYTDDMVVILPDGFEEPPITIGKFRIEIDFVYGNVRFYNTTNRRRGYWSSSDHHPHIDSSGAACYGSIATSVSELMGKYELCALVSVLISYLESVNLDDVAGKTIYNWSENPERLKRLIFNEGEDIRCSWCGDSVYEEEAIISNENYFCCTTCYDEWRAENGTWCENCGEWVHTDEEVYCEVLDVSFCSEECRDDYRDGRVHQCPECGELFIDGSPDSVYSNEVDELFCSEYCRDTYLSNAGVWCEQCGEWTPDGDSIYNFDIEMYFCCADCEDKYLQEHAATTYGNDAEEQDNIIQEEHERRIEL